MRPYDWAAHFAGSLIVVATTLCRRSDGLCLLYHGRVNWLYGGYECGKSWLALMAIIETINAGRVAVVIDHDDDASAWAERLRSVGITERQIIGQFRYYHAPGVPFTDLRTATRNEAFAVWWAGIVALDVGVVVIEGVTQVYAIEGYDAPGAPTSGRSTRRSSSTSPSATRPDRQWSSPTTCPSRTTAWPVTDR